jgi:putative phosphoribosyl transferase
MIFADRAQAGHCLAKLLEVYRHRNPVVLALPRGGVPVAVEIARALEAPLDVLMVRKIGVPNHLEWAAGAVAEGDPPELVVNDEVKRVMGLSPEFFREQAAILGRNLDLRAANFREGRAPVALEGRTAIVVDDGIATGATMRAALRAARRRGAATVVAAAPVAAAGTVAALKHDADAVVCVTIPEDFDAVGNYYSDFDQVDDATVKTLLRQIGPSGGGGGGDDGGPQWN